MGQGTDSVGGYDHDYDPYSDGLGCGVWKMRSGETISISKMTDDHIRSCIRICQRLSMSSSFECESEKWQCWVDLFKSELSSRGNQQIKQNKGESPKKQRGLMVNMVCHCGATYMARDADIKRGWGLSCSKKCAANRRVFSLPPAQKSTK